MLTALALLQFAALDSRATGVRTGEVRGDSTTAVESLSAVITSVDHARRVPSGAELERVSIAWEPPVFANGENLVVRGRALLSVTGLEPAAAVDWPLPLQVLTARECGAPSDWTRRRTRADTVWVSTFVHPDGTFEVELPRAEVRRSIGAWGRLEAAVALGDLDAERAVWRASDPILASSRTVLDIAGVPQMTPEQIAIHALRDAHPDALDPLAMIRCAELLRALGEARALEALRSCLAAAPPAMPFGPAADWYDPLNVDSASPRVVLPLVALLWDPRVAAAETSATPVLVDCGELAALAGGVGPPSHVLVLDGLPLIVACRTLAIWDGPGPDFRPALDWAEQHGTWRAAPIAPRGAAWLALDAARRDVSLERACETIPRGSCIGPDHPGPRSPHSQVLFQAETQIERLLAGSLGRPALENERARLLWAPQLARYVLADGPIAPFGPGGPGGTGGSGG